MLLQDLLEDFGLSVRAVKNGKQALELYKSDPKSFDVVISDIKMPQMDGVSLLSALKQDNTIPMPKFVFITGGVHLDLSKLDIDCDGTILKPYDEDEVFTLLHQLLNIKPA